MPYVIERKGSVKCNSHQGNTHYYQGTLSPLTCWEKASPGWYIPIVSSQTYFKRDCTGGSGSTKLPGSSTMGGTCYNNYEKQSSRFWPPTNEYGWCSGRWGWSYPCRRYSCQVKSLQFSVHDLSSYVYSFFVLFANGSTSLKYTVTIWQSVLQVRGAQLSGCDYWPFQTNKIPYRKRLGPLLCEKVQLYAPYS